MTAKELYNEAHKLFFQREYPSAWRDGHYSKPKWPDTSTANGLTTYIINVINWMGYRATRVNVAGRLIDKMVKTEAGNLFKEKRMIKSSTRKGSADVSSTIKGRSYMFEVKIGRDRPSEHQLKEQARERRAGGEYYFIKTADEFAELFLQIHHG